MKEKNMKNAKIGKYEEEAYWRPRPIPSDSNTPIYFDKDVVRNADMFNGLEMQRSTAENMHAP